MSEIKSTKSVFEVTGISSDKPTTGYVYFSTETLNKLPACKEGDKVFCPHCDEEHELFTSGENNSYLFVKCDGRTILAGCMSRLILGIQPDKSGSVPTEVAEEIMHRGETQKEK